MLEYEAEYTEICNPPILGLVLIPGHWNISYAQTLCKSIGGDMNVIKDEANHELVGQLALHDSCKQRPDQDFGRVWNGWWDEQEEGVFSSIIDFDEKLENQHFSPWRGGEPNGNTLENCGVVLKSRSGKPENSWIDVSCYDYMEQSCAACQVPKMPIFILKGK